MDVSVEMNMQPNYYSMKNWNSKSMLFDSGKLLGGSQNTKKWRKSWWTGVRIVSFKLEAICFLVMHTLKLQGFF